MLRTGHIRREVDAPVLDRLSRPLLVRAESFPAGTRVRPHRHPWHQLVYALQGVLWVSTPAGDHLAPPQRAVWVPPHLEHTVLASEGAEMRSLYLDRTGAAPGPARCTVVQVPPLVRELIRAVAGLPTEYDPDGPGGRLVQVLLDQLGALPEVPFSLPLPREPRLAGLCRTLLARADAPGILADWAARAGMAERTLTRSFRRETGLSFQAWRRRARLLQAIPALEGGRSVTAVALDSGYASVPAFVAAFRAAFGKPPGSFVRDLTGGRP